MGGPCRPQITAARHTAACGAIRRWQSWWVRLAGRQAGGQAGRQAAEISPHLSACVALHLRHELNCICLSTAVPRPHYAATPGSLIAVRSLMGARAPLLQVCNRLLTKTACDAKLLEVGQEAAARYGAGANVWVLVSHKHHLSQPPPKLSVCRSLARQSLGIRTHKVIFQSLLASPWLGLVLNHLTGSWHQALQPKPTAPAAPPIFTHRRLFCCHRRVQACADAPLPGSAAALRGRGCG
jgi:hypothetical protein